MSEDKRGQNIRTADPENTFSCCGERRSTKRSETGKDDEQAKKATAVPNKPRRQKLTREEEALKTRSRHPVRHVLMRRHIPKESRIESVAVEIMRQLLRMAWNGSAVVIAEHRILYPWEAGIIIIAIFVGKNYKRGSCMSKIAIVTDSNSGISQAQAKEMGIYVVPMPFLINGKEYLDGIDLFPDEFYRFLRKMQMYLLLSHPRIR